MSEPQASTAVNVDAFIAATMPFHRPAPKPCPFPHILKHYRILTRNGATQVIGKCGWCSYRTSSIALAKFTKAELEAMPVLRDNRCPHCNSVGCPECSVPCARCKSYESVEWHHWAPWHLFHDANDWPQSPLCRYCHQLWHRIVTPNMSRKKSA